MCDVIEGKTLEEALEEGVKGGKGGKTPPFSGEGALCTRAWVRIAHAQYVTRAHAH